MNKRLILHLTFVVVFVVMLGISFNIVPTVFLPYIASLFATALFLAAIFQVVKRLQRQRAPVFSRRQRYR